MSRLPAVSNDEFSATVFQFADDVGVDPVWDLLVHPGAALPRAARDYADREADIDREVAWLAFADFLERAIAHASGGEVWKQLRTTLRIYEAYGVEEMSDEQRRRVVTSAPSEESDLDVPTPLDAQAIGCPVCGADSFVVVLYEPTAILGRCARCGHETRSADEIEAEGASPR